ncbi:MAG: SGNH/GDSL hydrolase family protein [Polyangiales bacterium]
MLTSPGAYLLTLLLTSMLLSPCGGDVRVASGESENTQGEETPSDTSAESSDSVQLDDAIETPPPSVEEPVPSRIVQRRDLPLVTPIGPEITNHIIGIAGRAERSETVFAKMGGSSVESRAYLHCLSRDRDLELGEFEALRPTIERFRSPRVQGQTSFSRTSLAAQVGWSLRQGLTGRPSRIIQEARITNARWALAFWGGNDVQGRNPRRYSERLLTMINQLEGRGVVPVLAATTPRGDDENMDKWARRYNQVTRGIAEALALPYIDFYTAIKALPNQGLAGDGVHPNVLLDGGRARACDFSEEGLQRGQNQRNLRTVQMLQGLAAASRTPVELESRPEGDAPLDITALPFAEVVQPSAAVLDGYSCAELSQQPGEEQVYRIEVDEAIALDFRVYRDDADLFYLGDSPEASSCVASAHNELSVVLTPGVHYVSVERAAESAPILIVDETIP